MKRKSAWLSFTACALSAATAIAPLHAEAPAVSAVASAKRDFSDVQMVAFPDGKVGFFEKGTGMLFIYNEELSVCETILKLPKLGKKFDMIQSPTRVPAEKK